MKRFALMVSLVLVAALPLAACGSTPESSEPPAEETKMILRAGTGDHVAEPAVVALAAALALAVAAVAAAAGEM